MSDELVKSGARCGAQTANGPCKSYPVKGGTRCTVHGGREQLFAARQRRLSSAAQSAIEEALQDPDLLDVRRPIAYMDAIIAETELIPTEEAVRKRAARKLIKGFDHHPEALLEIMRNPELREVYLTPTAEDLEETRLEMHAYSMKVLATYSKRQVEAVKVLEWGRVIREMAIPLFAELGLRILRVLRRHVPEDRIPQITAEIGKEMQLVLGEFVESSKK